jgi:hypothetical protein
MITLASVLEVGGWAGKRLVKINLTPFQVESIIQAAECVSSKGKWISKPIDIIDSNAFTLGHYNGVSFIRKEYK